jgi:hypothetical protein
MQVTGKILWNRLNGDEYYSIVHDTHYNECRQPHNEIACSLPTNGPGQAIADGRELAKQIIGA